MTIRAHIYDVNYLRVILIVLPLLLGGNCAKSKPIQKQKRESGITLTKLDVAGRGKTDTWRWTKANKDGTGEILIKEEIDLNLDGKVDLKKTYSQGKLAVIQMDLDFDRIFDLTEFYEDGILVRIESSHHFSGKPDTWRFYKKGTLIRIERDTNSDDKADEWRYYVDGKIERIGRDYNFDGVVDAWE